MQPFTKLTSKVIPLPAKDVDTDQIIPAQFLTSVSKQGYGENLFRRLKDSDPQFPFNRPEFKGAEVLVARSNFGCGSSREHAVWAIQGAGVRVVIAESFADIFSNNSAKNGLLLVTLPADAIESLLEGSKNGELAVTVDLDSQTVTAENATGAASVYEFAYDPFRKHCLLNGLDDIDYILTYNDTIQDFRQGFERPWMRDVNRTTGENTFRLKLADVKRPAGLAPVSEVFERNYAERRFQGQEGGVGQEGQKERAGQKDGSGEKVAAVGPQVTVVQEAQEQAVVGEGNTKGAAR